MLTRYKWLPSRPDRYRLEAIAFLTGFSVLVLEISGGRLIAPFFGASTYVWTAMIGVILGALAVGNIIGGRLADKQDPAVSMGLLLILAAFAVLGLAFFQHPLLVAITSLQLDIRLSACLAATALFAVPSVLIGMIFPHLVKLRLHSLQMVGRSTGRLEAAGTIGSISGTFAAGYVLLGFMGSRNIIIAAAVVLFIAALLAGLRFQRLQWVLFVLTAGLALVFGNNNSPGILADVDTSYSRYQVQELFLGDDIVHALVNSNTSLQSAVSVSDPSRPVFAYITRFYQVAQQAPARQRILVIGGGTYTFPQILVKTFPADIVKTVEVVEIDPALQELAEQYFYYQPSKRLHVYAEDGRTYLNQDHQPYDLIYLDAFSSSSPPFQLTTEQTIERLHSQLSAQGAVVVNLIAQYDAGTNEYLRAVTATYKTAFRHVSLYNANPAITDNQRKNFIIIATNDDATAQSLATIFSDQALRVQPGGRVLTDDFAPVERLTF